MKKNSDFADIVCVVLLLVGAFVRDKAVEGTGIEKVLVSFVTRRKENQESQPQEFHEKKSCICCGN